MRSILAEAARGLRASGAWPGGVGGGSWLASGASKRAVLANGTRGLACRVPRAVSLLAAGAAPNLSALRSGGVGMSLGRRFKAGGAAPGKRQADGEAPDPGLFLFKAAFMGSLAYCGFLVYPSARESMVESGAALMRTNSAMFAAQGMSRVRSSLRSREKCESTFGQSGGEPNRTTLALIKHLESPDGQARSEALALALKLVDLGCSSLLADAGAGEALRRLEKAGGADSRVGELLRSLP